MAEDRLVGVVAWETDNCRFDEAEISVLKCTARGKSHKARSTEEMSSTVRNVERVRKAFIVFNVVNEDLPAAVTAPRHLF